MRCSFGLFVKDVFFPYPISCSDQWYIVFWIWRWLISYNNSLDWCNEKLYKNNTDSIIYIIIYENTDIPNLLYIQFYTYIIQKWSLKRYLKYINCFLVVVVLLYTTLMLCITLHKHVMCHVVKIAWSFSNRMSDVELFTLFNNIIHL